MSQKLLVRPRFSRGDGTNGYMLKLAAANGLKVSSFRSLGVSFGTELANDGLCNPDGEPYLKELHSLALRLATAKHTDARRYCPLCLAEGNHADLLCEIAFCVACPRHGVEQRTACHDCGEQIAWSYGSTTHCTCGSDLRTHPTEKAIGSNALVAGILKHAALTGRASYGEFNDLTLPEWLALLDFLAKVSLGTLSNQKTGSARLFENEVSEARKSAAAAAEALEDWPKTFCERLAALQSGPEHADSARLTKVFGPLYRNIYSNLDAAAFDPVRLAFENHVAQNWWSGLSTRNSRLAVSKFVDTDPQWLNVMEVRRRLKLGHPAVRWLIDRGILEARCDLRGGRTFAYASRKSVESYEAHLANTIGANEAARLLGVNPRRANELAAALDIAQFPTGEEAGFAEALVSRHVVNELLELVRQSTPLKKTKDDEITLALVLSAWRLTAPELLTLFSRIRSGAVAVQGRLVRGNRADLSCLVVKNQDVQDIRPAHRRPGALTVQEVAADLKVKDSVVYHLIRSGLLKAYTSEERFKRSVISEKTLERFKTRYVLASGVAEAHSMSSITLRKYLASRGVKPQCAADKDGCRVLIFRNDDAYQSAMRAIEAGSEVANGLLRRGSSSLRLVPGIPESLLPDLDKASEGHIT